MTQFIEAVTVVNENIHSTTLAPVAAAGGGASAFTDLTDAPMTITPKGVLLGNTAGDAIEFGNAALIERQQTAEERTVTSSLTFSATGAEGDDPKAQASLTAYSAYGASGEESNEAGSGEATLAAMATSTDGGLVQFSLTVASNQDEFGSGTKSVSMSKTSAAVFRMYNFEVDASDATATMTVDAVEYSIAKAIKVVVGGSTYFRPLFGPVAP
jgi:hypothetical protein